jgi:hypothetical protein
VRYGASVKLAFASLVAIGCSAPPVATGPRMVGGCNGLETAIAPEPAVHVAVGTPLDSSSNPPATGMHYPIWAAYDRAYTSLERGYYIHDAEHGAIVLLYNCPDGCPDVVTGLEAVVRAMPVDPGCTAPVRNRALVVADPLLPADVMVAAVAWDVTYTATCVDPYLHAFASDHYNNGPEDLCSDGAVLGGTFIDP